jgi:hypothetical protein
MKNAKILGVIALVLTLSACGGGGADVVTNTTNTTMGQELMDLDASFKKGLLTESEYKKAKKNIMNRYDD